MLRTAFSALSLPAKPRFRDSSLILSCCTQLLLIYFFSPDIISTTHGDERKAFRFCQLIIFNLPFLTLNYTIVGGREKVTAFKPLSIFKSQPPDLRAALKAITSSTLTNNPLCDIISPSPADERHEFLVCRPACRAHLNPTTAT